MIRSTIRTSRLTESGNRAKNFQLTRDPRYFSNPRIRSIYRWNPQSVSFLRPNPPIHGPIHHPPLCSLFHVTCEFHRFLHRGWAHFLPFGGWQVYPASSGFSRSDATLRWDRNHCEQPFAFPSSMHVHVMTTNIQWQDSNENFNKTMGLISKTTTLHVHHAFIFAFLCHFCTNTTWRCLILRFMDNVNKQRRNLFFFLLLSLDMVPWNSIPFGFAYIWQSKKIGINNPRKYWISTAGSR